MNKKTIQMIIGYLFAICATVMASFYEIGLTMVRDVVGQTYDVRYTFSYESLYPFVGGIVLAISVAFFTKANGRMCWLIVAAVNLAIAIYRCFGLLPILAVANWLLGGVFITLFVISLLSKKDNPQ